MQNIANRLKNQSDFEYGLLREKGKYLTRDNSNHVKNITPTPPKKTPPRNGTEIQIWAKNFFFLQSHVKSYLHLSKRKKVSDFH